MLAIELGAQYLTNENLTRFFSGKRHKGHHPSLITMHPASRLPEQWG
jgi:hypothetical protein